MSRVAVIIPALNRSGLLELALGSVLGQSRKPDEIIVVDDGSSEDLSRVVGISGNDRVTWLRLSENRGPAAARNAGVQASSSDWICFLDSDDEWLPGKLEAQLLWHTENAEVEVSQVHEKWIWNGVEKAKPAAWEQRGGDLFFGAIDRCVIGPSCVMLSRNLWNETGGFDEFFRVCEDYELWLRLCLKHTVGLVSGEAFVEKKAGHDEQLSVVTPAMDRFRVHALIQLLGAEDLTPSQLQAVAEGIRKKSRILASGAEKRGNPEWTDGYGALARLSWETLGAEERRRWFEWSRCQCEAL